MNCAISGTAHDLRAPNLEIIYRRSCDQDDPTVFDFTGITGQCNQRIITVPCGDGCEMCKRVKAYGCRLKTCNLGDGRNIEVQDPTFVNLSDTQCNDLQLAIGGNNFADIATFQIAICNEIDGFIDSGLFGDLIISGPLPGLEIPYVVATVVNGVCTPTVISSFTAGEYLLDNCDGTANITIDASTP